MLVLNTNKLCRSAKNTYTLWGLHVANIFVWHKVMIPFLHLGNGYSEWIRLEKMY